MILFLLFCVISLPFYISIGYGNYFLTFIHSHPHQNVTAHGFQNIHKSWKFGVRV